MPAVTSPPRSEIRAVIRAKTRSESVSPPTRSRALPSSASSRGGIADVRHERARSQLARLDGEGFVGVRRKCLLVDPRSAVGVEAAEPGAVGVPVALRSQAVRGLQQPEGRA